MAIAPNQHRGPETRVRILEAVSLAKERTGWPVRRILKELEIPRASYYRYVRGEPKKPRKPRPRGAPPTPKERAAVIHFALRYTTMGYKMLANLLANEGAAFLRAYQVYRVLLEENLINRQKRNPQKALRRPAPPCFPNQVWHIDIMYVKLAGRWFYLVDIVDGYSRYLVHWRLHPTMHADTVMLTVQEALDKEGDGIRPVIVHDRGSQFAGKDWRDFCLFVKVLDVATRLAHPESNGKIERLHRTCRDEALAECEAWSFADAVSALMRWSRFYNERRPHSALNYLPPLVYHRGDVEASLAQREDSLRAAALARKAYWAGRTKETADVT